MPAIRVTITLPYYLRLAEGNYAVPFSVRSIGGCPNTSDDVKTASDSYRQ